MNCSEFEGMLERYLEASLDVHTLHRCERHLVECTACAELATLVRLPDAAVPEGFAAGTLTRMGRSACARAEELLADHVDGILAADESELLSAHLDGCQDCSALAQELQRLAKELPRMAHLLPDPGFVEAVLAATLPVHVRFRRKWESTWSRWLRRPRFASELAFVATLVVVLVIATPGSPLEAMPQRALDLARSEHLGINDPLALTDQVTRQIGALAEGEVVQGSIETVEELANDTVDVGQTVATTVGGWFGTIWGSVASSLQGAEENGAATNEEDATESNEETP